MTQLLQDCFELALAIPKGFVMVAGMQLAVLASMGAVMAVVHGTEVAAARIKAARAPIRVQRSAGGRYSVVYERGGKAYKVQGLGSEDAAKVVCDVLAVKECLEAGQPLERLRLRSSSTLTLSSTALSPAQRWWLQLTGFAELAKQLQASAAAADPDMPKHSLVAAAASGGHECALRLLLLVMPAEAVGSVLDRQLLDRAQLRGWHQITDALLGAAATANRRGELAMHWAARQGRTAAVEVLLEAAPASATAAAREGWLPIHCAAWGGHSSVARLLLEAAPTSATAANMGGYLPIHLAALTGHAAMVQLLLEAAPMLATAARWTGDLPLHFAVEAGHTAVVRLLLEAAPAAAMAANDEGHLPIHLAAKEGHAAIAQQLLEAAPATAMTADRGGRLPIYLAADGGHGDVARQLLEAAPASATVMDCVEGFLPIHAAACNGHDVVVRLLLEAAPHTVERLNARSRTPLVEALLHGHIEAARCLVAAGPADATLAVLAEASAACGSGYFTPLFAEFAVAHMPLSAAQWALFPSPCYGLSRALPAAVAHSPQQAALLMRHLPAADKQRLRTLALCLARAQRQQGVALPALATGRILALCLT